VRGASLVVWAIKDGREAADHMHKYMVKQARVRAASAKIAAE
jgi:glutamate synthase (NADPH) small chain